MKLTRGSRLATKLLLVGSVLGSAGTALAATWSGWDDSCSSKISWIYVKDEGIVFNLPTSRRVNLAADDANRFKYIIPVGSENYTAKVSALLSAHTAGQYVEVSYDKDSTSVYGPVRHFVVRNGEGYEFGTCPAD